MIFQKNIDDLDYNDVQFLLNDKIPESDMLDYKEEMMDDDALVKHVSAFANTRGGYIVFGIKESGKGGHPIATEGIKAPINKERIEQIILSNIQPRLHVKIHTIENEQNDNLFLILQVPDSGHKPHYNNKNNKFYKRFEFTSTPMSEQEISSMYKNRSYLLQNTKKYLDKITDIYNHEKVLLQIVVIPSIIDKQLIQTTNPEEFDWLDPNRINFEPAGFSFAPHHSFLPSHSIPSKHGVIHKDDRANLEIHRNGCIHYCADLGYFRDDDLVGVYIRDSLLAIRIMHVLQFAYVILSKHNYFDEVEIFICLKNTSRKLCIESPRRLFGSTFKSENNHIAIKRQYNVEQLQSDFSKITSSIMDEVFNNCGLWKCHYFDDDGNYSKMELNK